MDFVKIFIGVNGEGVIVRVVKMLVNVLGKDIKIKVFGGIWILEEIIRLVEVGVSRIGVFSSVRIMKDYLVS